MDARNYIPALMYGANLGVSVDLTDIVDQNGNEVIEIDGTTSAVNFVRVTNSATGNAVAITAQGDDTNVGLELTTKATGALTLDSGTTGAVNLGTGASAKTVTIGNTTGATAVAIKSGTGGTIVTSADDNAFTVGAAGATNPAFQIDASVSSPVNGLKLTASATTVDVALVVIGDTAVSGLTITGKAGGAAGVLGGALTLAGGAGNTTGAGGAVSLTGGAGGTSGAGGAATLAGGAAGTGSANAVGGQANVTGGAGQGTSAGGAVVLTSGASENGTAVNPGASGAITLAVGAAGTATTGTAGAGGAISLTGAAGGASTGASSTAGAGSDIALAAGAGGASSGGGDTGGRGGNVTLTAGAAGSGATAGLAGAVFVRGTFARKSISATATDTATLTVAQILSGTIRCTPTAAASYTMPTGTVLAAGLPAAFTTGDCIDFVLVNVATNDTFDITLLTAASGITLFGDVIVEANSAAGKPSAGTFRCELTGANAFNVIRIS